MWRQFKSSEVFVFKDLNLENIQRYCWAQLLQSVTHKY